MPVLACPYCGMQYQAPVSPPSAGPHAAMPSYGHPQVGKTSRQTGGQPADVGRCHCGCCGSCGRNFCFDLFGRRHGKGQLHPQRADVENGGSVRKLDVVSNRLAQFLFHVAEFLSNRLEKRGSYRHQSVRLALSCTVSKKKVRPLWRTLACGNGLCGRESYFRRRPPNNFMTNWVMSAKSKSPSPS